MTEFQIKLMEFVPTETLESLEDDLKKLIREYDIEGTIKDKKTGNELTIARDKNGNL